MSQTHIRYRIEFKSRMCEVYHYFSQFSDEESARRTLKSVRRARPNSVLRIRKIRIINGDIEQISILEDV